MMFWPAFEIIKSIISSIIESRIGQMALVGVVAWFWSAHNTNVAWETKIATERAQIEAIYQTEVQRQREATLEIQNRAEKRDAEHAEVVADMRATIEDYMNKVKEQPHVVTKNRVVNDCSIDSGFSSVVRQLDTTRNRKANASSGAGKLR